ncbi:MAG: hypothetical protein JNM18_25170 [Planctomycetaceae bacterium]|nr:hypothetical protein [Planctomycetaceae bacterium]
METAVVQKTGGLTPYQAALIQSAVRHEARALLLQRWLKTSIDTLSVADKLAFLRDISAATGSRDTCLRQAGLDRTDSAKTTLDALYNVGGNVTEYEPDDTTPPPAAPSPSPSTPATEGSTDA